MPAAAVPPAMPVAAMVAAMVTAMVTAMISAMVAVMGMVMLVIAEAEAERDRRPDIGRIAVVRVVRVVGIVGVVGGVRRRIRTAPKSNSEQQCGDEPDCPAFASRAHDQSIPNCEPGFSVVVRTKFSM